MKIYALNCIVNETLQDLFFLVIDGHTTPLQMAPKSISMPANLSQTLSENSCPSVILAPAAPAIATQQVVYIFNSFFFRK